MNRIGVVSFLVMMVLFSCQSGEDPRRTQAVEQDPVLTETAPAETQLSGVTDSTPSSERAADATAPQDAESGFDTFQTPVFDPSSISQEEKDTAKTAIQDLIQKLNGIIRAKNYNAWVSYLDDDYFAAISSADYLDRTSKSTVLVKQRIVLRSARDYFNHVVVPSRTNDRVDDIEYVSPIRVKAYTFNNKGEKLRLYDLERNGNEWKIIN